MNTISEARSLKDIEDIARSLPEIDTTASRAALERQGSLTKPPGALGRLEDLAIFMSGWQGTDKPKIENAQTIVFAGNHGICAQGVNPFPQSVTAQMVENFRAGGAAINQLCAVAGADLSVVDLDLDKPTLDCTQSEAMSESEVINYIKIGSQSIDIKSDIIILGEMGIGNSTIAAALAYAIFGDEPSDWVGRGTGSDDTGLIRKTDVISRAIERHSGSMGLGWLQAIGGREQAAICGAVLGARLKRIPVLLDGFICTAALTPMFSVNASIIDHCLAGHVSREPGHKKLLKKMRLDPLLSLNMALGEASGAVVALNILKSAVACQSGMATMFEAGITES